MSDDPSVPDLCCPTCGGGFHRLLRWEHGEEAVFEFGGGTGPTFAVHGRGRPYLTCQRGHKWTIKTLTRAINEYDRILLGEYLGE